MKTSLRLALVLLSGVGLSACASMDEQSSYMAPPDASASSSSIQEDAEYIAYVERMARIRGVEVVWVHVPYEKTGDEESDD